MKKPKPRQTAVEERVAKLIASHKIVIEAMLRIDADDRSKLWKAVRELQERSIIPKHVTDLAANTIRLESDLKRLGKKIDLHCDKCSVECHEHLLNVHENSIAKLTGEQKRIDEHLMYVRNAVTELRRDARLRRESESKQSEVLLRLHG